MTIESKTRIVTLSDRPPVKIREDEWPVIAVSSWHDGQIRSQANRAAWIKVRRHHTDGRLIVYGGAESSWQGERDHRAGRLLGCDADVATAIREVSGELGYVEQLAAECIADLPAEEI